MTLKQRNAINPTASWQEFLPRHALVMGRPKDGTAPARHVCQNTREISGNPDADLVFISAIGANESLPDPQARALLERMIEAMGLTPTQVCILTFFNACETCVGEEIQVLRPKVFVGLGPLVNQICLQSPAELAELRGKIRKLPSGAQWMPTFDPGFLLQTPHAKREAWSDLQKVATELGISIPPGPKRN